MVYSANKKGRTIFSKRLEIREKWKFNGCCYFDIIKNETTEIIGGIRYSETGEISYMIFQDFRNNGFAKEALSTLVPYVVKEPQIPFLRIRKENIISKKVAESTGFYIADDSNPTVDIWLLGAK